MDFNIPNVSHRSETEQSSSLQVNGLASGIGTEIRPEDFRIPQNFTALLQTKGMKAVRVVKPDQQLWISLHPTWRMTAIVLVDKVSRETYLVEPKLVPEVSEDLLPKLLVPYITRDGTIGIWPIRMPGEEGRLDSYNETALDIAATHTDGSWIRLRTNQTNSTYWAQEMSEKIECPAAKWPEGDFDSIFQRAFKNRVITSLNDRILRVLRGEVLS